MYMCACITESLIHVRLYLRKNSKVAWGISGHGVFPITYTKAVLCCKTLSFWAQLQPCAGSYLATTYLTAKAGAFFPSACRSLALVVIRDKQPRLLEEASIDPFSLSIEAKALRYNYAEIKYRSNRVPISHFRLVLALDVERGQPRAN